MKNITWVIIFAAVAVVCAVFCLFMPQGGGNEVAVYQDGELLYTIDLASVTETYEIPLERGDGVNVIEVSPGSIRVKEANCPDGTCVKRGAIEDKVTPIVCLPNKVVIEYTDSVGEVDAVAGVAG